MHNGETTHNLKNQCFPIFCRVTFLSCAVTGIPVEKRRRRLPCLSGRNQQHRHSEARLQWETPNETNQISLRVERPWEGQGFRRIHTTFGGAPLRPRSVEWRGAPPCRALETSDHSTEVSEGRSARCDVLAELVTSGARRWTW